MSAPSFIMSKAHRSIRLFLHPFVLLALICFASSSPLAQVNIPVTIQEMLPFNETGISRTQDPVTFGIPIPDSANLKDISTLGLSGASVGQFRVTARWPSGNVKWILVDTQADVAPRGQNSTISVTGGAGNFGGANIATDNGATISINTGVAQFTIKKANYNGIDSAIVNGKTIVASGASTGLMLLGPDITIPDVSAPAVPTAVAISGGSQTTTSSLYVRITYETVSGESAASNSTAAVSVGAGQLLKATSPVGGTNITGYNVYVGTSSTGQRRQNKYAIPIGTDWTQPNAPILDVSYGAYLYPKVSAVGSGCGNCNVVYTSSNDAASSCSIEENGPARAAIKCMGDLKDSAGHVYMHFTTRSHFFKNKADAKITVALRNADDVTADLNKGFKQFELRIKTTLSGTKQYSFGTDQIGTPITGSIASGKRAYIYQGYSDKFEDSDFNATANYGVPIYRNGTPSKYSGTTWTYDQEGYAIVANDTTVKTGTRSQYPSGWADFRDGNGAGISVGHYQMAAYFAKSILYDDSTAELQIGIWPDQNLWPTPNTGIPYVQAWPQYSIHDVYLNFHDTYTAGDSAAERDFLKWQYHLIGRGSINSYNDAKVFPYPLIDPAQEDAFYKANGITCCLADGLGSNRVFRNYAWIAPGGFNQADFRLMYLQQFLTRGIVGRYMWAQHFFRYMTEQAFPYLDGVSGGWRSKSTSVLDSHGYPTAVSGNTRVTRAWADDPLHQHTYGLFDGYYLAGDEWIKDLVDAGFKDRFLNLKIHDTHTLSLRRSIGIALMNEARLHRFLTDQSDPDAPIAFQAAEQLLNNDVLSEIQMNGQGTSKSCSTDPFLSNLNCGGQSKKRGILWGPNGPFDPQNGNSNAKITQPFQNSIEIEGLYEYATERGSGWSRYEDALDTAYGLGQWTTGSEGYLIGIPNCNSPTVTEGFMYVASFEWPNGTDCEYRPSIAQTVWFNFYILYAYAGDTSWGSKLVHTISLNSAARGTGWEENSGYSVQAPVYALLNPNSKPLLQSVPLTVTKNGSSYTLSWTVPSGTQGYKLKYFDRATNILDGPLRYDNVSDCQAGSAQSVPRQCWIDDPNANDPFFAGTNCNAFNPICGDEPAPQSAGTIQTLTLNGFDSTKTYTFALKAYTTGTAPVGDITPPQVSLTAPIAGSTVSGNVSLAATATDNVGVYGVQFKVDGTNIGPEDITPPYQATWDSTKVGNGSHTVSVVARDAANNVNSATASVTVSNTTNDTTAPSVSISSPTAGATLSGTVTVAAYATDNVGVVGVQFLLDGNPLNAEVTSSPFSTIWITGSVADGSHTLAARARDAAGNTKTSVAITVTVNNTSTGGGGGSGSGAWRKIPTGTPWPRFRGFYKLNYDNYQNKTLWYTSDNNYNIYSNGIWAYSTSTHSWSQRTSSGTTSPTTCTTVVNSPHPTDRHPYAHSAYDPIRHELLQTMGVCSDSSITGYVPSDTWAYNSETNSWTNIGTFPGVKIVEGSMGYDPTNDVYVFYGGQVVGSASNKLFEFSRTSSSWKQVTATGAVPPALGAPAFAYDTVHKKLAMFGGYASAGAKETSKTNDLYFYDSPAHTWTKASPATKPPATFYPDFVFDTARQQFVLFVPDPTGNTALNQVWTYDVATGNWVSMNITGGPQMYVPSCGRHCFGMAYDESTDTIVVTNYGGTAGAYPETWELKIGNSAPIPDNTAPTVSFSTPSDGQTVAGSVSVSATATDNVAVGGVTFKADGVVIGSEVTSPPYTVIWNAAALQNGSHTLTATARDLSGNSSSANIVVNVNNFPPDSQPPSVSITSPLAGATVNGVVTITVNAIDNVQVTNVQVQIDGVNLGSPLQALPYTVSWDTTTASSTNHTISAFAYDPSGNRGDAAPVVVTVANRSVDSVAPSVAITAPQNGATISGSFTVTANASDNIGVVGVQFFLDGSPLGTEDLQAPYSVAWNTSGAGTHVLTAVARDAAGNKTTSAAITVTTNNATKNPDSTPPVVKFTSPVNNSTLGDLVAISVNATDDTGVTGVQFSIDNVPIGAELTAAPFSLSWNSNSVANGQHIISASAHDATGNVGSAQIVLNVVNPPPLAGNALGVTLDTSTVFAVQPEDTSQILSCPECYFQSSDDLVPGQNLEIHQRQGASPPVADRIVLKMSVIDGTIVGFQDNTITVKPNNVLLANQTVVVLTDSSITQMENFGSTQIQLAQKVSVRGILLRSTPAGGPTMLAKQVKLRK